MNEEIKQMAQKLKEQQEEIEQLQKEKMVRSNIETS